jgi:hypothetical protein
MTLAIAAFLTAGITSAYAEGDRNYFDVRPNGNLVANPDVAGVTGSDAYPVLRNDQAVPVVAGGTLPTNGSDGIVQTANSLPASTIYGTTAFANAAHGRPSRQVAGSAGKPRG